MNISNNNNDVIIIILHYTNYINIIHILFICTERGGYQTFDTVWKVTNQANPSKNINDEVKQLQSCKCSM